MAEPGVSLVECQSCGKKVGVRPDQFGRRLRCPACQTAFKVDPPVAVARAVPRPPRPPADDGFEVVADEAGELAVAGPAARRSAATASFPQPPAVVFDATAYAVRKAGGEVVQLDRVNFHVRFRAGGFAGEHTVYVFPAPTGGSELEIRAATAGGRADDALYARIASG